MTEPRFAADMLKSFVERVERLETEIAELNSDKSDLFKEAKSNGFDVKALKAVIAYRRKDPVDQEEHELYVATYLRALEEKSTIGTPVATRARARDDADTLTAPTCEDLAQVQNAQPPVPAQPSAAPPQTAQALQASVALTRAGGDAFDEPIPDFLDCKSPQNWRNA